MLKLKVNMTSSKLLTLCDNTNIKFNSNCIVNWGDGVISTISNMKDMTHKYKKMGEYVITITNLDTEMIRFTNCKELIEVQGKLPKLGVDGIVGMFEGCINLTDVDPLYFIENKLQHNATRLCKDCYRLKDISFILPLSELEIIDSFLEECYSITNINIIAKCKFGYKVTSANKAFRGIKLSPAPDKDILTAMEELKYANSIFENWTMMNECYPYFINNLKLKRIDNAFKGNPIKRIDSNWLYYLPNGVETDKLCIFDKDVYSKLNGV